MSQPFPKSILQCHYHAILVLHQKYGEFVRMLQFSSGNAL